MSDFMLNVLNSISAGGFAPDPTGGLTTLPRPLAGFKGHTFMVRDEKGGNGRGYIQPPIFLSSRRCDHSSQKHKRSTTNDVIEIVQLVMNSMRNTTF